MDFYHVLPSNTSSNYFPNNNASQYSTPLNNPYVLSGNWEVGLMNLTYSTCVNTFNNDRIVVEEEKRTTKIITLPPVSFEKESEAIRFINEKVNDKRITFSCNATKHVTLNITDQTLKITFDDTLRDIFAFDQNTYSGALTCEASDLFSLNRRIQYLYIYSNITDFVRVGNTEATLLGIVPFLKEKGCSLFKERIFKSPMYIRVIRDHISQIDIAIYDGAGQLVPFVNNSVTSLRLHFRQI